MSEIIGRYTEDGSIVRASDGATVPVGHRWHDELLAAAQGGDIIEAWEPEPVDLAAYAAAKRWEKEVGGIEVGGMAIHTDDRSKSLIMGARLAASLDPQFATEWKTASGGFVTVDAGHVTAISDAVLAHVADCFAIEAAVLDGIANETITSPAEIDAAFAD